MESLDERKTKILQFVVESYIATGEPVGSRTISKQENLQFSPATIRNEMADLEEMGYLEQPHVSSGRIPSDLGYRYYIEHIMPKPIVPQVDMKDIEQLIREKATQINTLIRELAELYTKLLNYTVFALPDENNMVLRGMANLLNYPEYSDIQKARQLLQFLDNADNLRENLLPADAKNKMDIIIGNENSADELKDCSMVVSRYRTKDDQTVSIGIIGPKRMDYSKAVSTLEFLTSQLERMEEDDE